jgi:hypothetical protein
MPPIKKHLDSALRPRSKWRTPVSPGKQRTSRLNSRRRTDRRFDLGTREPNVSAVRLQNPYGAPREQYKPEAA